MKTRTQLFNQQPVTDTQDGTLTPDAPAQAVKLHKLKYLFTEDGLTTVERAVQLKQAFSGTLGRSSPEDCALTLLKIVETWYETAAKSLAQKTEA